VAELDEVALGFFRKPELQINLTAFDHLFAGWFRGVNVLNAWGVARL
jgi:hypothetical protein